MVGGGPVPFRPVIFDPAMNGSIQIKIPPSVVCQDGVPCQITFLNGGGMLVDGINSGVVVFKQLFQLRCVPKFDGDGIWIVFFPHVEIGLKLWGHRRTGTWP